MAFVTLSQFDDKENRPKNRSWKNQIPDQKSTLYRTAHLLQCKYPVRKTTRNMDKCVYAILSTLNEIRYYNEEEETHFYHKYVFSMSIIQVKNNYQNVCNTKVSLQIGCACGYKITFKQSLHLEIVSQLQRVYTLI